MRKCLFLLPVLLVVSAFLPVAAWAHNDPQPDNFAIYTGYKAFNDNVCADCHDGGLNTSFGNVKLSFNGNSSATTYTPGATIPIQITITDTGGARTTWGFELAARFATQKQAGTFTASSVGCPTSNTNCTHTLPIASPPAQANVIVITHFNAVFQQGNSFTFTVNWTAPAAGSGQVFFSVAGNAANGDGQQTGDRIYTTEVTLSAGSSTPPPTVPSNGVVEGAGFAHTIAAGGIASIFGSNLAAGTLAAGALPLPQTLGATSVTMNGTKCGLFFVSSTQINFQVPWELQTSPTASLIVTAEGGPSTSITIPISSAAPGIFTVGGVSGAPNQGAIQIANGANAGAFAATAGSIPGVNSSPATAGQFITIYASGLGQVTNTPADGTAAGTGSSLSVVSGQVSVSIGGVNIPSSTPGFFAGLSPGFVGLYQVNVPVPSGLGKNSAAQVVVTATNLTSNTATIAVQ
jgi:uncharacterized protein (TIGR03437 family)